MMRRVALPTTATVGAQAATISTYGFGHADLSENFHVPTIVGTGTPKGEAAPKVTKMPNGARVVSHDRDGAVSSVGFYLKAGAKYDPSNRPGLNMVMRFALGDSNMQDSKFQIDRTQRASGISNSHDQIRKEYLLWKNEGRRDAWTAAFTDLSNSISAPRFAKWDTDKWRDLMDNLLEEKRWTQPRDFCIDALETAAFYKQPLGSPTYVPEAANDLCDHKALVEQWARLCVPRNVVVAGVNVDHEELVATYQNAPYAHSADAPHHAGSQPLVPTLAEVNQYSAREEQNFEDRSTAKLGTKEGIEDAVITALAYPVAGGASHPNAHANVLVLNELLAMSVGDGLATASGDASFEQHIRGPQSFGRSFEGVSLLGVTTQSNIGDATKDVVEANNLLTKGVSVTAGNVKIAQVRAATKFYHNNLEYQRDYLDFLGTSLVGETTNQNSSQDILKAIEATTADSINAVYKPAVQANKPSFYATGATTALPSLRQMGI